MSILSDSVGAGIFAPLILVPGILALPLALWVQLLGKGSSGPLVDLLDMQRVGKGGPATNSLTGGSMYERNRLTQVGVQTLCPLVNIRLGLVLVHTLSSLLGRNLLSPRNLLLALGWRSLFSSLSPCL